PFDIAEAYYADCLKGGTVCDLTSNNVPNILEKYSAAASAAKAADTRVRVARMGLSSGVLDDNTHVSLDLRNTNTTRLTTRFGKPVTSVGGFLNLAGTRITELPNGLTVGGDCDLHDSRIAALPERFTVGGDLNLRGTSITELPDSLKVGGKIL